MAPFGLKQEADEKKRGLAMGNSDYLTVLNAYKVCFVAALCHIYLTNYLLVVMLFVRIKNFNTFHIQFP